MLLVFHGTDTAGARAKVRELVDDLSAKKPDASLLRFDAESFAPEQLPELLYGQGLFSQKYLVVLDMLFERSEYQEAVLDALPDIAQSENVFVLLEGKLDAKSKKALEKHAQKTQVCDAKGGAAGAAPQKSPPKTFLVADALGARDKKMLWVRYREAIDAGHAPEEIHGVLFWQIKSMLIALATSNAAEADMKDYPYNKAKRFAKNYSEEELKRIANELVTLYHEARLGKGELEGLLEKWILEK